jgi:KDO2-lipid IV(A) lauroyltransferase
MELITSTPSDFSGQELARLIIKKIEDSIRARPANYLWTHRRWKRSWKKEYAPFWIDTTPMPEEN